MKKRHSPGLWLLLIPAQAVAAVAFVALGGFLDSLVFSNPDPEVTGHGIPIFTVLFFLAAGIASVIVLVVALAGFIGSIRRNRKERKSHNR